LDTDSPFIVRIATAEYLPDMIRLERQCVTAAHWTEHQYASLFQTQEAASSRLALIAERKVPAQPHDEKSPVFGFLIARHVAPEWELENIVVAPEFRGKGIGTQLMEALLTRARYTNSESVLLEVRESNAAARALYEKLGFQETGRRKSYYTNPLEDAVLYSRSVLFSPQRR
jgi:ribosomal-protein-alanine N-acetyltransferase